MTMSECTRRSVRYNVLVRTRDRDCGTRWFTFVLGQVLNTFQLILWSWKVECFF